MIVNDGCLSIKIAQNDIGADYMKRKIIVLLLTTFVIFGLVGCMDTRAENPYESPSTYEETRINMLQSVEPSVIGVQSDTGFGSGVIFQKEATDDENKYLYYALTNYHVVEEGGELKIYYGDVYSTIPVQDVQGNATYDVAVVRFVSSMNFQVLDIKPISENTTYEIIAGQDVYAIGTPNDLENFNYITSGIVSLASQTYNGITNLAIMHNAELNPGNSGGPLFNLNGDVIGLNVAKDTAIATETGDIAAEGLNYALNMNTIAPIVRGFDEEDYETVVRSAKLGVTVVEIADYLEEYPEDADQFDNNASGIVVAGFDYSRNAVLVLEELDLIVAIDGVTVETIEDIAAALDGADFGDIFEVTIVRKEGTSFVTHTYDIELS